MSQVHKERLNLTIRTNWFGPCFVQGQGAISGLSALVTNRLVRKFLPIVSISKCSPTIKRSCQFSPVWTFWHWITYANFEIGATDETIGYYGDDEEGATRCTRGGCGYGGCSCSAGNANDFAIGKLKACTWRNIISTTIEELNFGFEVITISHTKMSCLRSRDHYRSGVVLYLSV